MEEDADLSQDAIWNSGVDAALIELCAVLDVDVESFSWDAATEDVGGDIRAVIGNIMRAKYGEDWDPKSVIPCHRCGHLCNWPARPQACDGRHGADAYSAALDQLDDRQCADCGYPVGDKPVFLGGVWFCATCNPAEI
jgi:hypothetical protein